MVVLDTNHLTEPGYATRLGIRLTERLEMSQLPAVTTIVCAEEQLRGWLARIAVIRDAEEQIAAYAELGDRIHFLAKFTLLPWDKKAADQFRKPRRQGLRIGSMDLKIACITLSYDAILLTRNSKDFTKVPGLKFENWLD